MAAILKNGRHLGFLGGQICLVYLMESSRQFWCLYHHLHDYVAYLHLAAQLFGQIGRL